MTKDGGVPRPVTLVTGASRGIGAATARLLSRNGHDVALTYLERDDEIQSVVADCRDAGARVFVGQVDLSDTDGAPELIARVLAELGRIDNLVNNAGVTGQVGNFTDLKLRDVELLMRVNVVSPLRLAQSVIAHLLDSGAPGSIVNISSTAATTGAPNTYIPYAMSKASVHAMTIGLAKEYGPHGIRVNTVTPGTIRTEIHALSGNPDAPAQRAPTIPLRRAGEPEEVAGAVAYLLSPAAGYVSGAEIRVTGAV